MQISEHNLFRTPDNFKELEDWIERHTPEERIHLYTAAFMAWNLAARITNNTAEEAA